ncbi:hypothetical protein ATANTOWER_013896, partial [Ataeniobius toweri]|nr:hypothetical protein [Ataeniobius toweri]
MLLLIFLVALMFAEYGENVPLIDIQTLQNRTYHPETLEELLSDQNTLDEGDLLMLKDRNAVGPFWPTTDLPYDVQPDINHRMNHIIAAMKMVSEHTCITFHRRNSSEKNYVLFQTGNGCASHVGFIGGQQHVYVAPSCSVGNIAHEILHTLGFQHEHTRLDRDKFINVVQSNIIPGMEKNFRKLDGQTFNIPYDYTSIMHYGR